MPSRKNTIQHAVAIFRQTTRRYGASADRAWLGIYAALLWYEPTGDPAYPFLPHIIDADKLRRPRGRGSARPESRLGAWQRRAAALEAYLAQQMGCAPAEVRGRVDRVMRTAEYRPLQRQNPLGIASIGLVHYVLSTFGDQRLSYEMEQHAAHVFPGITFPGRSSAPSVDVLVRKKRLPRAIVSVKWSLRHDRINDLTNECPAYKQAASWGRHPLDYIVVTNEYDPARLSKVLGDACIDAVVHVHKPAVIEVAGLDGRLHSLMDLTGLFDLTHRL